MVRDPRAACHSLMKINRENIHRVTKPACLALWNEYNEDAYGQCVEVGPKRCIKINYERLVMNLESTMRKVAVFLNVAWTDNFLRHDQLIGTKIKVSSTEWSTHQIKRKIYLDSLIAWRRETRFCEEDLDSKAGVHKALGYNARVKNYNNFKEWL
jgi:protein-tyrosine sulfotransferase